ncbi:hypothetical protein POM88_030133 [Heracleum sosnowskyi]|uniref:Glutamine amidotransferase type-2 domain-containing protein n=1 Tax=Heracleum sosnowskyi TaxID=360622 RepID=A0AAD8HVE6_9APIA|nr:hypothetical protein POM88_030133 [Heracleum sosnowskyi]
MCGILAVLGCSDDSQAKRARVLELSRRLKHRVNGEIYNHEELQKSLHNHIFKTGSDCDVIAHLYEEHGENFVDMLDGVFSFVLLDTSDNSFIAARDAIGITPLYIGWGLDGSIWISSEMKGLNDDCEPRHFTNTKAAKQCEPQLQSFCVGLKGSPDLKAGNEVADYLGTIRHEFHFTVQDGIDALEAVIYHIETYDVTTIRASTPMFLMSPPNKEEFHHQTCLKIKVLHQYDCLRANKATSDWGLEAWVPFLDKEFIDVVMSIDPEWKMGTNNLNECVVGFQIKPEENRIEKWIFRRAFYDEERPYLPKHILYRQKEQFSDGVDYSWIDGLKDHAKLHVSDKMMLNDPNIFPHNTPVTKEAYYYRMIFERFFP